MRSMVNVELHAVLLLICAFVVVYVLTLTNVKLSTSRDTLVLRRYYTCLETSHVMSTVTWP